MRLTVLGSSSEGNCYLLTTKTNETLIIEAGVPYTSVARTLGRDAAKICGCIISHEHRDHSGRIKELMEQGITVHAGVETIEHIKATRKEIPQGWNDRLTCGTTHTIGEFVVLPFPVTHDVPCLGFLIQHPEMGTLAFLTDTQYSTHKFTGISHIMVEANYDEEIVIRNIREAEESGDTDKAIGLRARLARLKVTHMEINTTLNLLKANTEQNTIEKVVLIHTSKENGDPEDFRMRAIKATGCQVYNAAPGLKVELNRHGNHGRE